MFNKAPLHPLSGNASRCNNVTSLDAPLLIGCPNPVELLAIAFGVNGAVIRQAVLHLEARATAQALPERALISANLYSLDAARRLRTAAQHMALPISGVFHE